MIFKYFDKVKTNIDNYCEERGFIEGEIMFIDDSRLDFAEVKDIEINQKIKYHYHYMDTDNNMIFRYDNAKHHKDIKSFPHHKHFLNTIDESSEPEITIVLNEIENIVLKK